MQINALTIIAVVLVTLGFGQLAAGVGIFFRYAIPRSPRIFHWLILPPLGVMVMVDFLLAWMALTGVDAVFGLDALMMLLLYYCCADLVWWSLVGYAVYHWTRGRRCPV